MKGKTFRVVAIVTIALLAVPLAAGAQTTKVPTIGVVAPARLAEHCRRVSGGGREVGAVPGSVWRAPATEVRSHCHRLPSSRGGMIKSSPQKIIAQGSDLRFVNELKKELKG